MPLRHRARQADRPGVEARALRGRRRLDRRRHRRSRRRHGARDGGRAGMFVTIRLFARLREIAGSAELTRELPEGATAEAAWSALAGEFPALGDYRRTTSCAVNAD